MSMFNRVADRIAAQARASAVNRATQTAENLVRSALENAFLPLTTQKVAAFGGTVPATETVRAAYDRKSPAEAARVWRRTKNPFLGGITPEEAQEIFNQMQGQDYARKNLWFLEISSHLNDGAQNIPDLFNLFATSVSYTPGNISGEATKIGAANYDVLQGIEPVELSITTYDDQTGSLKKWFASHMAAAVSSDGTVAEPETYAITVKIIHGFTRRQGADDAYENIGFFRPVSMELNLDRHENGFEEITMQFAQLDTFMRP